MSKHILRFVAEAGPRDAVRYGPFLRHVLDSLVDGCQQATRLRLEGRSSAPGTVPAWLEHAASFHILGFDLDAIVLGAPPLGDAIEDKLWRGRALADLDPARSSLDLLEDSLEHAIQGREDSDRYDRNLMATLESFGRLLHYGIDAIDVINGRTLRVDTSAVKVIRALRTRTPEDRHVALTGTLEAIHHSDRRFSVALDSGDVVRGVAASARIRAGDLAALFGKPVIVRGIAKYRPSGSILRIEADDMQLAAGAEASPPSDVEAELRRLFEEGRIQEARDRVQAESERGQEGAVRVWAALLAPPTAEARPRSGRADFDRNRGWLQEHGDEHRGEWIALRDGTLVDSDRSFLALRERLRSSGVEREVFLTKLESRGEQPSGA